MSWEISWALCRACMDADSELFPLYDYTEVNNVDFDLSNNLAELADIKISKSDGLPAKLCEECILKIKAFCKFKKLVQESDRKLRNLFIPELTWDTKNNETKDGKELELDDQVQNQIENALEDCVENEMDEQLENRMKEEEEEMEEEMEIKMKIKYAESEIDVTESCIFNNEDESSFDIEKYSVQDDGVIGDKSKFDTNCYIANSGKNSCDVLKSSMWEIVYNEEENGNTDEKNDYAQSIPVVLRKELENQELISKTERKRKSQTKAKTKKMKVDENIENSAIDRKEADNNSDTDSDFDSYTENMDNTVGSLNDTITKVKEIRENGKETIYQCTLCLQNYTVLSEALSHIVDWHIPVNGPFYCVVCEMDCNSIKHLKNHVKIHKGDNPYICFICEKAYVMKRYLKRHMVCHTDFPRHRCAKCGMRFKVKSDLEIHFQSHIEVVAFRCSQCAKVFKHKGNYKRHLITHLDPKGVHIPRFPCYVCNKRFINNRTLENHMRVHTGERPFKCDLCNKRFSQKANLLNHVKVHTNPRSFVCDVCGKKFNQKATLKDHSRIHTGEKSYVCTVCGIAFTFSAALGRHMWTHSDTKPFACDICDATFIGSYDLKRHKKTHNGNSKRKRKPKKVDEEKVTDISQDVSQIVQETSDGNTIVIEQIFLCQDSIEIISQEESGKENADSLLCLI